VAYFKMTAQHLPGRNEAHLPR